MMKSIFFSKLVNYLHRRSAAACLNSMCKRRSIWFRNRWQRGRSAWGKPSRHFTRANAQKGRTMMKNKYLTFSYDDGVTQDSNSSATHWLTWGVWVCSSFAHPMKATASYKHWARPSSWGAPQTPGIQRWKNDRRHDRAENRWLCLRLRSIL